MIALYRLKELREEFGAAIQRADCPNDHRLFLFVDPADVKRVCRHIFRDLDARYVISIGSDDRPFSGSFMVAHNFAFDKDHLLCRPTTRGSTASPAWFRRQTGRNEKSAT